MASELVRLRVCDLVLGEAFVTETLRQAGYLDAWRGEGLAEIVIGTERQVVSGDMPVLVPPTRIHRTRQELLRERFLLASVPRRSKRGRR